MSNKRLIVVVGPTAVGKTAECIRLAKLLNTEIVSADSRQFYKEMNIGVARPSESELKAVQHHFIAHISVCQAYNAATYEKEALNTIEELFGRKDDVVLTGGSGLYVNALCNGIDDIPDGDKAIREELNRLFEEQGLEPLQRELQARDPEYWNIVDKQNHIRLIRALEVCRQTGKTFTSFRSQEKKKRDFDIIKIGIRRSREELLERIYRRVDCMIEQGLIEEVKGLYEYRNLQALNTVGYKELFDFLEGRASMQDAVERIKINTRRYAKRQMTWFCKDKEIQWLNAEKDLDWKFLSR